MTTSSNTTKREKVTLKKSEVVPSNFHLEEKHYAPMVVIGGETTFGAWCGTEEEAAARLNHLEIAMDYHNYPTKQEDGSVLWRAMDNDITLSKSLCQSQSPPPFPHPSIL